MKKFNVHFLKEQNRDINVEAVIAFFEVIEGFTKEIDEDSVRFIYKHPRLGYEAKFIIMPKSQIADIHRLNPKYLDINFHLEIPILSPDYFARDVFMIAKKLTQKFDYYTYQAYFEDVLPFKLELVLKIFNLVKEKYLELNPSYLDEYYLVKKEKLSAVLRYADDMLQLHKYYQEMDTYVPLYHCYINEDNMVKFAIEWKHDTLTVFPPYLDYIVINRNNEMVIIKYDEAREKLSKYLEEVPGFLRNTFVISKKNKRKAHRIMRRNKFSKVNDKLTKIKMSTLLD